MGRIFVPAMFGERQQLRPSARGYYCHHQPPRVQPACLQGDLFHGMLPPFHTAENPLHELLKSCFQLRKSFDTYRKPWIQVLQVKGYDPEDIEVKVEGNKVLLHARHESIDGDNVDISETRRVINIPDTVDAKKLVSFLREDDVLVIKGPYLQSEDCERETAAKTSGRSADSGETTKKEGPATVSSTKTTPTAEEPAPGKEAVLENETVTVKETKPLEEPAIEMEKHVTTPTTPEAAETSLRGLFKKLADEVLAADRPEAEMNSPLEPEDLAGTPDDHGEEFVHLDMSGSSLGDSETTFLENEDNLTEPAEAPESEDEDEAVTVTRQDGSLLPLMDSTQIIEQDGKKEYQLKINLDQFAPEDVSIRCHDNTVYIDAVRKWERDGMLMTQEVHRQFSLPSEGSLDSAKAGVDSSGLVTVSVPLNTGDDRERLVPIERL